MYAQWKENMSGILLYVMTKYGMFLGIFDKVSAKSDKMVQEEKTNKNIVSKT